jgi:hypothetical protein
VFGEESMSRTRVFESCSVRGKLKNTRQVKSKVKSILNIFFEIKKTVHKEFVLTGQTINSAHYCGVLRRVRESVRRLRPELWRQKNWLLQHENASSYMTFFAREFVTTNNTTVITHSHYFFLFSRWKIKLKGSNFDTT